MIEEAADTATQKIKSADRVLDVFEVLIRNPQGMTFPELVRELRVPKSSLHGLLGVLVERQYLVLDHDARRYVFGVQLFELGQAFLKHHPETREAKPVMEAIAAEVNETVQLALLRGTEGINLATVECTHPLRMQLQVGRHFSGHATSLGKVLLAHLPDDEVRNRFAAQPLERFTENTFQTLDELLGELRRIRMRGFSLDTEECIPGVFCVGVPIFAHAGVVATGLSVTIPTTRLSVELFTNALSSLARGSVSVSRRMGVREPLAQLEHLSHPENAARAGGETQARRWLFGS